jgi:hypothetical protein
VPGLHFPVLSNSKACTCLFRHLGKSILLDSNGHVPANLHLSHAHKLFSVHWLIGLDMRLSIVMWTMVVVYKLYYQANLIP